MTSQIDINQAARLLGGKPSRTNRNRISCPGPGHNKADRSLSVTFLPDGSFTTNSFAGDDWRECRDYVKRVLGIDDREPRQIIAPSPALPSTGSTRARVDMLQRLWNSCIPIAGTLGEVYLNSRGLSYDGDGWRYRPIGNKLVGIITDVLTCEPIGYHETLLDAVGRKIVRLIHGRASGGCVRLYDLEPPFGLAIAEGIETALAADFRPVWACLSSSIMKGFPVLPHIEAITVFADHDKAGIEAANEVGERWHAAGREVILTTPAKCGTDFADRRAA